MSRQSSNSIPDFNKEGVLPPGVYFTEDSEFQSRFDGCTNSSSTRARILDNFNKLRGESLEAGVNGVLWVDGSFVEAVVDPNDIDVVTWVDHDTYESSTVRAKSFIERWLDKGRGIDRYLTDGSFRICCSVEHWYYEVFKADWFYWRKHYGRRKHDLEPKGFIGIEMGESGDVAEFLEEIQP